MNTNKIDKALQRLVQMLGDQTRSECIVKANDFARLRSILLHKKIPILNEYLFINSFRVILNRKELSQLSNMTQVRFLSSVSMASTQMHIAKQILGVDKTKNTGRGVCVAFIDTGIVEHGDFCIGEKRLLKFKDFVGERESPYDDNGHGTFVAGVCSGNGALSCGQYCGIAPQSNIIALKALNASGEASADKILNAMEWVYDNHSEYNIKIVCMSFGSDPLGFNDPIMAGAEALWRAGIVVVAAAGNSGPEYQTIKSPGVSSQIITVGGLNDNRADPGGVFVFRFEEAKLVNPSLITLSSIPPSGKVPVVYQVDFEDPGSFLVTQNFMMQDKDVMYVANMPSAEVEKFMRMVGMVLTPTLNLGRYQLQMSE